MGLGVAAGTAVRRTATVLRTRDGGGLAALPAVIAQNTNFLDPKRCPELDCIRGLLPPETIEAAKERAAKVGVSAEQVLIAAGTLSEELYLRALGKSLGVAFEPLDSLPRALWPTDDKTLVGCLSNGLLPLSERNDLTLVVAPRGLSVRRLIAMFKADPALTCRFRFTTTERLNRLVLRHGGKALAARATDQLAERYPDFSAGPKWRRRLPIRTVIAALATLFGAVLAPEITLHVASVMLSTLFLAWLGLRLASACIAAPTANAPTRPDDALPVYTIIAALYREAASVEGLMRAIEQLEYPAEKLDVVIALEADDSETRAAIEARDSRIPFTVVPVPAGEPRTKPKALNVALPFARGSFTVVYDAEDRPEPDQLRRALQAFDTEGATLACAQARLCIDNTADGWLARLFTAEYAGQFDAFLPGLAARHLPLPLGGSSNHFHTATLRAIGGWDAYNVTEDADIGMRLARFGYRTTVIASTTYEEAPARIRAWLRQRTRWFKGWMQTWQVHMRAPRTLKRELGWAGFICFQLIVGGNALAALLHPLFLIAMAAVALNGAPLWTDDPLIGIALPTLYVATAALGYLVSVLLAWVGLKRRGLAANAWVLLLTPLHWLLLSAAAWRALYQLIVAPYRWEKTAHGLAKHSRVADDLARVLVELEGYLRKLKERGELNWQRSGERQADSAAATFC